MNAKLKAWLVDTAENIGLVAVLPFLGTLISEQGGLFHVAPWKAAAAAGVSAGLAALYSAVAALRKNTISPASLMPAQQPGQVEQDAPPPADADGITTARVHQRLAQLPHATGNKLGRRPKPRDRRDFKLGRYLTAAVPAPPSAVNWARAVPSFPMLLNNRIGDCGEAGWLHMLQVWLANVGRFFTPNDAQALTLYEAVAGYNPNDPSSDQGTVLRDLLKYVRGHAVAGGHRIAAYVAVDPRDHVQVKQALALFGCLYAGVELTQAAYHDQGVHWRRVQGAKGQPDPELGHCVVYTGYDRRGLKTVTWGQEGTETWGWHDDCCVELWAVLSPDWMTSAGKNPGGVDWTALEQDLTAL